MQVVKNTHEEKSFGHFCQLTSYNFTILTIRSQICLCFLICDTLTKKSKQGGSVGNQIDITALTLLNIPQYSVQTVQNSALECLELMYQKQHMRKVFFRKCKTEGHKVGTKVINCKKKKKKNPQIFLQKFSSFMVRFTKIRHSSQKIRYSTCRRN